MLDNATTRSRTAALIEPAAKALLGMGVKPDMVTWAGTVSLVAVAATVIAPGHLAAGGWLFIAISATDLLDGTMARLSGTSGPWGSFLDSSLDRVADASIMLGIVWVTTHSYRHDVAAAAACAALVGGQVTSYVRARAESVGASCKVGLAERGERNILMTAALVFSGVHHLVLPSVLCVLACATWITVGQRMVHVRSQLDTRS
jgi:CDP-diacylglycerol--glycerol-3-phosphate 3-phosphatidyltransferase